MADIRWIGGSGIWSATNTANWSTGTVPNSGDNVIFDQVGTYTVSFNTGYTALCNNFTVSAGSVTFAANGSATISGSFSVIAGTLFTNTGTFTFNGSSSQTLTTNNVVFNNNWTFSGSGGWVLQDSLNIASNRTITLTTGTLNLNNNTLTCGSFSSDSGLSRELAFGTGTIVLTGIFWDTSPSTNLTVTGTPVVYSTYSGISSVLINPGTLLEASAISFVFSGTGNTSYTIASSTSSVKNITFTSTFSGSWNNAPALTIYGDFLYQAPTALLITGLLTFAGTNASNLIEVNSGSAGSYTFNAAGKTWSVQNKFVGGVATLTNGTLNLNGYACSCNTFTTGVGTKNITFNGGILDVRGSSFNNAAPTGFTTTAGTANGIISMSFTSNKTFAGGGLTCPSRG